MTDKNVGLNGCLGRGLRQRGQHGFGHFEACWAGAGKLNLVVETAQLGEHKCRDEFLSGRNC